MTDHPVATKIADFNEEEFKQFGVRQGDRWSFSLPYSEMQNLDDVLLDMGCVLGVETKFLQPHGEIILGKLIPKK
jgi:hypothetical protein